MQRIYFYVFFMVVFSIFGLVSIISGKNSKGPQSQDNPNTEEIVENRFGNYCDDCGATIKDKANYCVNCGKKL